MSYEVLFEVFYIYDEECIEGVCCCLCVMENDG